MAFTKQDIDDKKLELEAVTSAWMESLSTGGVTDFKQGTTEFTKASTAELKKIKDALSNELYRMES